LVWVARFGLSNQRNDISDEFPETKIIQKSFLDEISVFIHHQLLEVIVFWNLFKENAVMPFLDFNGERLVNLYFNMRLWLLNLHFLAVLMVEIILQKICFDSFVKEHVSVAGF
jgi:hypothetical protein